jgi:hypothetical protein
VSPAAVGCDVPVDRRQRMGESTCQKERPQRKGGKLRPLRIGQPPRRWWGAPDYSKSFLRTKVPIKTWVPACFDPNGLIEGTAARYVG